MMDLTLLLAIQIKSTVISGKGGSFKCDRNYVNASTKIYEHTIGVAKKYHKLTDSINKTQIRCIYY